MVRRPPGLRPDRAKFLLTGFSFAKMTERVFRWVRNWSFRTTMSAAALQEIVDKCGFKDNLGPRMAQGLENNAIIRLVKPRTIKASGRAGLSLSAPWVTPR